jgi:hypothetical protein
MPNVRCYVKIQCLDNILSNEEILNLIPEDTLKKIKEKDEHPLLQAYSIGHEGKATPTIIGKKTPVIEWPRKAIQSMKNLVLKGIKFFIGHNKDNSTTDRKSYGEVIANTEKEIDGKLHHIVIGHFPDKEAVKDKDICSQEGEWDFIQTASKWIADKAYEITGIILGKSSEDKPAFPGAKRIGMVQAFSVVENNIENNINDGKEKNSMPEKIDLTQISFSDLVQEAQRRNIRPGDLFKWEDLKNERRFKDEWKKIDDLEKASIEKDKKLETMENSIKQYEAEKEKSSSADRYSKILDTMTLTDKQKETLKDSFDPSLVNDVSEEGLKNYAGVQLKLYSSFVKSHDIKVDLPDNNESGDKNNDDNKDITKPENNEFLIKTE